MMYPPDQPPIRFEVHSEADWETSDRFIRFELFCRASTSIFESMLGMIGYDPERNLYRMWTFSRSQAEPMYLAGGFDENRLIVVSEPSPMIWGIQRLRYTITPLEESGFDILGEYWTLEGWERYSTARMKRVD
jgi:hypothetical protein